MEDQDVTMRAAADIAAPIIDGIPVPDLEALFHYGPEFTDMLVREKFAYVEVYKGLREREKIQFARDNARVPESRILEKLAEFLQPRAQELATERKGDGPSYRDVGLFGRLLYGGVLPTHDFTEDPTLEQVIQWCEKIRNSVTDKRQLQQSFFTQVHIARGEESRLKAADASINAVLATLVPLASRQQVVFSAIFSLERLMAIERSVFNNGTWFSPSGKPHECEPCRLTGAPLYFKKPAELAEDIRDQTGSNVLVMPGSLAMMEMVATILAVRKPTWDMQTFRLDTLPAAPSCKSMWMTAKWQATLRRVLETLPAWAADYPPPVNLVGGDRMAEYIHYVLYKVMESDPKLLVLPNDMTVHVWMDMQLRPAYDEYLADWRAVASFADYYAKAKLGQAPVNSFAGGVQECNARRAEENSNSYLTDMLGSSTANGHHSEPRSANAIAKHGVNLRTSTGQGVAEPKAVDYCGVDTGTAIPAIRAKWADVKIHTYGTQAMRSNTEEFTLWDMSNGYPSTADYLYDDSFGEGSKDQEAKTALKVAALQNARYGAGVIKIYPTSKATVNYKKTTKGIQIILPYNLSELPKLYVNVVIVSPGRAHSPEFYVVFSGRRVKPASDGDVTATVERMYATLMFKTALMGVANRFRSFIFRHAYPTTFTEAVLPAAAGETNLISQAMKVLGYGYEQTPSLYGWKALVAQARTVVSDVGVDAMPDIADLARRLTLDEPFDPAPAVRKHPLSEGAGPSGDVGAPVTHKKIRVAQDAGMDVDDTGGDEEDVEGKEKKKE